MTSTVLTHRSAARHTWQTSHSEPTTSSASTICVTTWHCHLTTSYSASTTTPSSMRSTQYLLTTHVLRLSSQVLSLRATTRCSRNISRSWSVSLTFSASLPHSTSQRPSSSSPRVRRLTTRRSWRKASSLSIVHTRPCLRTSRSSSTSLRKVSRLACSRQRSTIWRTTTAACPRP